MMRKYLGGAPPVPEKENEHLRWGESRLLAMRNFRLAACYADKWPSWVESKRLKTILLLDRAGELQKEQR